MKTITIFGTYLYVFSFKESIAKGKITLVLPNHFLLTFNGQLPDETIIPDFNETISPTKLGNLIVPQLIESQEFKTIIPPKKTEEGWKLLKIKKLKINLDSDSPSKQTGITIIDEFGKETKLEL